jgi:hypothetical protein
MTTYRVVRTGRTWAVADAKGTIVEGGFFARSAAQDARDVWAAAVSTD